VRQEPSSSSSSSSTLRCSTGLVLAALALAGVGCDQRARSMLSVGVPTVVAEGENTQVTVTVTNSLREPMIPLTLTLYVRPDPAQYLVQQQALGEVEFYKPLQATEVRHHQTLDRIEADHIRDGDQWRHVPDSRFLHPRILLSGQSVSETFQFQAMQSHRKLLACDLYYVPLSGDRARGRLFLRSKPKEVPPDAERYTEVFTRMDETQFADPNPQPANYVLYRPARIHDKAPQVVTANVRINVQPQQFTYRDAVRRTRLGTRATCYFAAGAAWVFDYPDEGTWFVCQDTVTKLKGHYAALIADLDRRRATVVTLTAPRKPDDRLLSHLEKSGYSDPTAKGPNAVATIPTKDLLRLLEQAESLGYTIEGTTWKPMPAAQ